MSLTHSGHSLRSLGGSSSQSTFCGVSGQFGHVGQKCQSWAVGSARYSIGTWDYKGQKILRLSENFLQTKNSIGREVIFKGLPRTRAAVVNGRALLGREAAQFLDDAIAQTQVNKRQRLWIKLHGPIEQEQCIAIVAKNLNRVRGTRFKDGSF